MKFLGCVLTGCVCMLLMVEASIPQQQQLIEEAQQRRELMLEEREAEYHKELQLKHEKKMAALRVEQQQRSRGKGRVTPINPDDHSAILDLYQSTGGPKWANNSGWMKGDPCTDIWFGIYCIDGRVLQINLVYNQLVGQLPSSLNRLSELQVIRLYSNFLSGEIPPGLFSLKSLQVLDVNSNQLSGTIPSRIDLANLTDLILYGNNIKGEFPTTFHAPKLQLLEVSSNSFSGNLPEGLSESTDLTQLVVSRNAFTGGLPSSYGSLVKLERLWTFYNNFDRPEIPESYRSFVNLVEIQADGLSGEMPQWIGSSWRKLKYLIVINGWLSGNFPESLCGCKDMISLRLFNNSLSGELPDCICQMEKMTDIEISDNQFTGNIPDNFQGCRSLETMYFSRNNFTGKFPVSLGELVNLTVIDVSTNGLYGTIPNSINKLSEVIANFAICFNMFSDIESGVDDFFKRIVDYTCLFYNNPWSCPMSTTVPKECSASCSTCNAPAQRQSCSTCVQKSPGCGWCQVGQNCLEAYNKRPDSYYKCKLGDWRVGGC